MKRKDLHSLIQSSFNEETPNLLDNIHNKCLNETQMEKNVIYENTPIKKGSSLFKKLSFCTASIIIFILGLLIGNFNPNTTTVMATDTSIYLDVNPSIEIQVDNKNCVFECIAENDDGSKILENIDLKGVKIETALYAIVGSMYTNGYLNQDTNSILVSLKSKNNEILLNDIASQIDNVFKENDNMDCSIIAQNIQTNKDLEKLADEYNISIGKMHLIMKIINSSDMYLEDDIAELSTMSIQELNLIYASIFNSTHENCDDDIISGKPNGFVDTNDALTIVLDSLELSIENLYWYEVIALYHHDDLEDRKMIYMVSFILKGENIKYKYIVDCKNGEILPDDTINDWEDRHEEDPFDKEPPRK